jgi:hypothetical protein
MPKPNKNNEFIRFSVTTLELRDYTFCMLEKGESEEYIVRVFPHDDRDSFWLREGEPWETESGVAWSILNFLEQANRE